MEEPAMDLLTKDSIAALDDVIAICRDAERGFRGAANAVDNPVYKNLFNEYSVQRGAFATELQTAMTKMNVQAAEPSGAAGSLHAAWMSLKGSLTGHGEHEILAEAERGEDLSVRAYREAIAKDMPPDLRKVVEKQYAQVMQAHNHIKSLRDSTAKK
jgi:uncharacterized protein (TIGR02284 family)